MKRVCALVTVLLAAVSIAPAQQTVGMNVVHHNIASGGRPKIAADHIVDLMNMTPQKAVLVINEANYARQYFDLPHPGWHHIWRGSPHEGRGNPTFVRDAAARMMASWILPMEESWTHNKPKDPRVYTVVKCELVKHPWIQFHCANVHFPTARAGNGPARQESVDKLIELSQSMPKLPLIICGDFNMEAPEARRRIADAIGGRLYSNAKVDHIIVRDGTDVGIGDDVTVTRLGTMGSDHQVLRYNLKFSLLDNSSQIADWTLY